MSDLRVWPRAEDAPNDLYMVEVEGYGLWVRVHKDGQLFEHVDGVYKLQRFHRLRELATPGALWRAAWRVRSGAVHPARLALPPRVSCRSGP